MLPKQIVDFTNQIDKVYRGLGLPTLYGLLSIMANKSVFYLSERGHGKTRTIRLIPNLPNTTVSNWDSFTLEGLAINIGQVENEHLVWKVEEFSTLRKYHRQIFTDVVPKIISDGNYYHQTKKLWIEIRNCKLDLLIAIQPLIFSELCRTETRWESMAVDRFSKVLLLNPLRKDTVNVELQPILPKDLRTDVQLSKKIDLTPIVNLFREQVSRGRATLFTEDYIKALAGFLAETEVTQDHVKLFHDLFGVYLDAFNRLQYCRDLEEATEIYGGAMKLLTEIGSHNEGVEKQHLAETFKVSERNIEKYAKVLLSKKIALIRKEEGKGRGRKTKYRLNDKLEEFFSSYNESLRPSSSPF